MTLSTLFRILDSNNSQDLTKSEFHSAMNKGGINMDADEVSALFDHLDKNRDGKIGYPELLE